MSRQRIVKRRRVSPGESNGTNSLPTPSNGTPLSEDTKWDLEEEYEQRRRKLKSKHKENNRLPIRTAAGWVQPEAESEPEDDENQSFHGFDDNEDDDQEAEAEPTLEKKPKVPLRQQIIEAKEELARLAGLVEEDPDEHIGALRRLKEVGDNPNVAIKNLALVTQLAIYKDIIPGYRIRSLSEDDPKTKLSKEVRKLKNFEHALVCGYQEYVETLANLAKGSRQGSGDSARIATVAINCACNLLISVPHFNFRSKLLGITKTKLSTRVVDADHAKCTETLRTLFQNDEEGYASYEAVAMLTKMIKERSYNVDESVLDTFLNLRLLSEFAYKGSRDKIDRPDDEARKGKKPKEKRVFRTKRERKDAKEAKKLEHEMKEAEATVSHEERERIQGQTLMLVFAVYLRILKVGSPRLMGAALEGLARYSHLINQDQFGDILVVLKELIQKSRTIPNLDEEEGEDPLPRNVSRESLLCVITAFALLQGQEASKAASQLHLDLSEFTTHLYNTLYPVSLNADIELSAKSLHLPDPHSTRPPKTLASNKVNVQTTIVLLIRSLRSVLLPAHIRNIPPVRLAAFCKRLLTASLHMPEKSCLAMLGLMTEVTKKHGRKIAALWNTEERRGDGKYYPLHEQLEGSNPFASTVWEGELLRKHFCPKVRDGVVGLEKNILDAR